MMSSYTTGTGGGDGNPVVSSVWQDRDALQSITYNKNKSLGKIYLSVVHIYDKSKGWPLTVVKGQVPEEFVADDNSSSVARTPTAAIHKSQVSSGQQAIISAMKSSLEHRRTEMTKISSELVSVMKSLGDDSANVIDQTGKQIQLQKAIEHTNTQLGIFSNERRSLKRDKKTLGKNPSSPSKIRKRKKIVETIQLKDELIKQYTNTLKIHMKKLAEVNGGDSLSDEDGSSASSCSD